MPSTGASARGRRQQATVTLDTMCEIDYSLVCLRISRETSSSARLRRHDRAPLHPGSTAASSMTVMQALKGTIPAI
jgi:hypothetical protein